MMRAQKKWENVRWATECVASLLPRLLLLLLVHFYDNKNYDQITQKSKNIARKADGDVDGRWLWPKEGIKGKNGISKASIFLFFLYHQYIILMIM